MAKERQNIITYVLNELDSFDERPFCEVDSLILAWISYYRVPAEIDERASSWEGMALHEMLRAENFDDMFRNCFDPVSSKELLFVVCANPRFRDIRMVGCRSKFDENSEEQFAACTFLLPDGHVYVAFRGTDSSLVGWKEDFNMAFMCPVPAQSDAVSYLVDAAAACEGPILIGGHSKGGNLAVYAAARANDALRPRIERVFSHDGPGFNEPFLASEGFLQIKDRVHKTMPHSAIIGLIMESQEDYALVESTSFSIFQHDPFTWVVEGVEFKPSEEFSASARYLDSTLSKWLADIGPEERGRFVDTLFAVLNVTDAHSFADIRDSWRVSVPKMLEAIGEIDPDTKKFLGDTLSDLAKCAIVDQTSDAASSFARKISELFSSAAR